MKSFPHSFRLSTLKSTLFAPRAPEGFMQKCNALTVVELFQSQGCSSCPPANSNVLKLTKDPNLLVLTYDMTYWDRLGWKDTFGDSANDRRQWEYARALSRQTVFTPQAIVNGQVDSVGKNARELQSVLAKGNDFGAPQTVTKVSVMNGKGFTVSGPENERGLVNVVRYNPKYYEVPISHGEKGGRTLPHSHVIKDVRQIGIWIVGSQQFELPHVKDVDLKVAVLVQASIGI